MGVIDIGQLRELLNALTDQFQNQSAHVGDDGVILRKLLREMAESIQKHALVIDNRFFDEMKTSDGNRRRSGTRFDFSDVGIRGEKKRVSPKKTSANLRKN